MWKREMNGSDIVKGNVEESSVDEGTDNNSDIFEE